jgi:excisionase family DNA binding protein
MKMEKHLSIHNDKQEALPLHAGRRQLTGDSHCLTVSVETAARILGISRGAAYAHARDGSLPTIKLGKRLLVPKAALDKLLAVEVRDAR